MRAIFSAVGTMTFLGLIMWLNWVANRDTVLDTIPANSLCVFRGVSVWTTRTVVREEGRQYLKVIDGFKQYLVDPDRLQYCNWVPCNKGECLYELMEGV